MAINPAILTRRTAIMLRPDTHKTLEAMAKKSSVSVGEICRRAVLAYIKAGKESK